MLKWVWKGGNIVFILLFDVSLFMTSLYLIIMEDKPGGLAVTGIFKSLFVLKCKRDLLVPKQATSAEKWIE